MTLATSKINKQIYSAIRRGQTNHWPDQHFWLIAALIFASLFFDIKTFPVAWDQTPGGSSFVKCLGTVCNKATPVANVINTVL